MRRLSSARLANLTQISAPVRPAVAHYAQMREFNGDPGPSTRRQSVQRSDRADKSSRASFGQDRQQDQRNGRSNGRPSRHDEVGGRYELNRAGLGGRGEDRSRNGLRTGHTSDRSRPASPSPGSTYKNTTSSRQRPDGTSKTNLVSSYQRPQNWNPEVANARRKAFDFRKGSPPSTSSLPSRRSSFGTNALERKFYPPGNPQTTSPRNTWRRGHIFVLPTSDKATEHRLDAFETSRRISQWVKDHPSPIAHKDVDELLRMVMDAPRYRVNSVVWNQVLSILGKENRLGNMYRGLQFMKKRGYRPDSRTYTIMLNAFAGARHMNDEVKFNPLDRPMERIWQRILTVYNDSQAHISSCINQLNAIKRKAATKETKDPADLGVEGDVKLIEEGSIRPHLPTAVELEQDIGVTPTNAYLKLLGRYAMWDQMDKVHLAMDKSGPLSPDAQTYSLLFSSLIYRWAQQNDGRYKAAKEKLTKIMTPNQYGDSVKGLWDEMIRRFHPAIGDATKADPKRRLDEDAALIGLKALIGGRPSDQVLACKLIPFIWDLPISENAVPASMSIESSTSSTRSRAGADIPHYMQTIPALPITPKSATAIIQMLSKANKLTQAARHARHFWNLPDLRKKMDYAAIKSLIFALASDGDVDLIKDIMAQYQPPTGKMGWQPIIWENALIATRQKSDFNAAVEMFRQMTHLPYGVEDGVPVEDRKNYVWKRAGHQDVRGVNFHQPSGQAPTAKAMSLLFKSAFTPTSGSAMEQNVRKAFNIVSYFPLKTFFIISPMEFTRGKEINLLEDQAEDYKGEIHVSLIVAAEWRILLAKDIDRATDFLLETASEEEKSPLQNLRGRMKKLILTWGKLLNSKNFSANRAVGAREGAHHGVESGNGGGPTIMARTGSALSGLPLRREVSNVGVGRNVSIRPEEAEEELEETRGEFEGLSDEEFERRLEEEMMLDEEEMRKEGMDQNLWEDEKDDRRGGRGGVGRGGGRVVQGRGGRRR